ncbi:hypothetical protein SAMN05421855_101835 [Ulvibacter litoralis]|uniref:Uncharacterized protein n=1 Tax=Ulvibacter litoralis TaxID=227084 RepID=A0A1G7D959_9FLAO|nr:hypothetical protein SAMN05421855_101835 [Ulvibacter litoralis]
MVEKTEVLKSDFSVIEFFSDSSMVDVSENIKSCT